MADHSAKSKDGNVYNFLIGKGKDSGKFHVMTNDNRVNVRYGPFDTQQDAQEARRAIIRHMNETGQFHPLRDGNKWYEEVDDLPPRAPQPEKSDG